MTESEQKRIKAIQLYVSGKKVSSICNNLNKSRKWFYKWKKRYDSGNKDWFKDLSRAPKHPTKINEDLEKLVIKIRKELMEEKYARIGPQTIHWELKRLEVEPPSLSTIKRIIKKNNLIVKKTKYHKKGTPYPNIPICGPNVVNQVDFWGPRYITGDGRFYSFNISDGFIEYHNNNYRYSPLGGKTPNEAFKRDRLTKEFFKDDYKISTDMPIKDGYIHIIRLIRSDLKLNIFGETFKMPKTLKYEYVVATICTDSHMIRIYDNQWKSLFTIPYSLPVG